MTRKYYYTSEKKVDKDSFEYNLYKAVSMLEALGHIEHMVMNQKWLEEQGVPADYPTESELLSLYREVVTQTILCLCPAINDIQAYTLSHNDGRMIYTEEGHADTCDIDGEPTGCTAGYDLTNELLMKILEKRGEKND